MRKHLPQRPQIPAVLVQLADLLQVPTVLLADRLPPGGPVAGHAGGAGCRLGFGVGVGVGFGAGVRVGGLGVGVGSFRWLGGGGRGGAESMAHGFFFCQGE